jgi:LETM1 and EF-hand domain-containing protein 1
MLTYQVVPLGYTPPRGVSSAYSLLHPRNAHQLPARVTATAILTSRREITTETSGSAGVPTGPPPGFNPQEAQKPIPKESQNASSNSKTSTPTSTDPSRNTATAEDKAISSESHLTTTTTTTKDASKDKKVEAAKKEEKKLTVAQKVRKEVMHYWDGTKLLATEIKISTRLALKMAAGYELSRREHRQVRNLPPSQNSMLMI